MSLENVRGANPSLTVAELAFIEGFVASTALAVYPDIEADIMEGLADYFDVAIVKYAIEDCRTMRDALSNDKNLALLLDSEAPNSGGALELHRQWVRGFNAASSMCAEFWEDFYTSPEASALMYPIIAFTYGSDGTSALDATEEEIASVQRDLMGDMNPILRGLRLFIDGDDDNDTLH